MTRIPPVRRLLMDAKALIAKPENWNQLGFARSAANRQVGIFSPQAHKFCVWGALIRVAGMDSVPEFMDAEVLLFNTCDDHLAAFNDAPSTTHPMIIRLFNQAIRRAKEQGI